MQDLNAISLSALFTSLTGDGSLRRLLELARDEDLGVGGNPGDITSRVTAESEQVCAARVACRQPGVLAGMACIAPVLELFAPKSRVNIHIQDGARVDAGDTAATIRGPLREVLQAERTMLNLIGRLSGVATRTAAFVAKLDGLNVKLLDTRKTTPGMRSLEKYAVRCGGGFCHRIGLHDAVLIKDNHIAAVPLDNLAMFVSQATTNARSLASTHGGLRFIELEVDRLDQLGVILNAGGCGVDIVLLDNMPPDTMREAVRMRDASKLRIELEASGGVRLETVRAIAESGVDRISVGGLTHQAVSLDFGLDID